MRIKHGIALEKNPTGSDFVKKRKLIQNLRSPLRNKISISPHEIFRPASVAVRKSAAHESYPLSATGKRRLENDIFITS